MVGGEGLRHIGSDGRHLEGGEARRRGGPPRNRYGIGPDAGEFNAGSAPSGAVEGANDAGGEGYAPPCPPEGDDPHRYVFTVHALPAAPDLDAGASPSDPVDVIKAAAITSVELTGTYGR